MWSDRAQNTANILGECLVVLWCLMCVVGFCWGFISPKMANFDSRTYCNTFWAILGTSKNVTKCRTLGPLFITEILHKRLEQLWPIFHKWIEAIPSQTSPTLDFYGAQGE